MATDLETSVAELIVNTNIVSDVINEDAATEVSTSNGTIPSLRKALADNLYFQDPVPWSNGTNETEFNQLRTFTDGTVWWSPSATTVNPVPMGATPVGDSNWYPWQDRNLKNNILEEVTRFNIKGTFAAGFTYETVDDVGLDNSGNPWSYTGSLPFTVTAGTTPTSPTYFQENFANHNATVNRNVSSAHNATALDYTFNSITQTIKKKLDSYSISVEDFGAVGDGVNDDAVPIRAAITYAHSLGGGVKIRFPKPSNFYALKSTVTDSQSRQACLIIPAPTAAFDDPISLVGEVPNTRIRVADPVSGAFAGIVFEGTSLYKQVKNLDFWGGTAINTPLVDHVVYGADGYHSNMVIEASRFYVASEDCIRLATFVTTMTNVQTAYAKRGFKIAGPDEVNDVTTSLTMNSCYGLECTENAYWFGNTTYCTLNACAADAVEGFAYRIGIARGVTLNGCGCESSDAILQVLTAQGLQINGFYTLSIGTTSGTATPALIDIAGGESTTIAGVHLQNPNNFDFIVQLGTTFGTETVSILDSSINPREVTFVPNLANTNPFKFLVWDTSNRNFTWPITTTQSLIDVLARFENTQQNHVQTLQFPDGDFTLTAPVNALITRVGGRGQIVFKGGTNSRIVVGGANQFTVGDTPETLDVIFEDIDLHMTALSGISQGFVFRGRNIRFDNSNITSSNNFIQYAVAGRCGIFFDSNSAAQTAFFASGNEYSVTLAPRSTAPSGPYPNRSIAYAENPDGTTNGWIRGSGGWFAFS